MLRPTRAQHVAIAIRRANLPYKSKSLPRLRYRSTVSPTHLVKPPAKPRAPPSTFARSRALPWVLTSITAFGIALYGGALVASVWKTNHNPEIADLAQQRDVSARYNDTADSFDSEVGISEIFLGINRIRKKLAKQCTGHVLEVSCGTGRNLGYYDINRDSSIESLTFVDLSPQMIDVCKKKWQVLFGSPTETSKAKKNFKSGLIVRFLAGSALDTMPPAPSKDKYDTIIQTMGLCSTPSPKELLLNIIRHLDTSNPEARILLLEHGRSYRSWMNKILDGAAEKHADIHGCWFNRDIGALVEEAATQTGFRVTSERRHHLGTTSVFELRPDPELMERMKAEEKPARATSQPAEPTQTRSWKSWIGLE